MCGINAIFSYKGASGGVDREELRRVRDSMTLRGPDGRGEWYSVDNRVGLGHRRLAIIDISESGAQPMTTADGDTVITFNGEIYNYRSLRSGLEKKGYRFRSFSDTEVLLRLYEEKGADMLHDLRGMFAFAIWDNRKKGLFLARDPFGIKPLYYSDDGSVFRTASQVKALLKGGHTDTSPEPAGHVGFFLWGHVPSPYTLYRGIRSLPAGAHMWVDDKGRGDAVTYCSIPKILADAERLQSRTAPLDLKARLREAMLESVGRHLVSDVPVGIFLSSGMDSTTLVALAGEISSTDLRTVTLGFREYLGTPDDETGPAERIAGLYATDHQNIWVSKDDFKTDSGRLLDSMDQPSIDGVNSYFISKAAVKAGLKVALSGLGGDELFGSYPSFRQVPKIVDVVAPLTRFPFVGRAFRAVSAPLLRHFTSPKYAGILEYGGSYGGAYLLRRGMFMPWELPEILDAEMVREGLEELQTLARLDETVTSIAGPHLKVAALEMCWYMRNQLLRDADWAGMAHSLEVRTPLVDIRLLSEIASLPASGSSISKLDMAKTPARPLPDEILRRQKTGFSVPVRQWMSDNEAINITGERGLRGWAKYIYSSGFGFALQRKGVGPRIHRNAGPAGTIPVGGSETQINGSSSAEGFRVLSLVTDAFGGHGGIALYNRDVLTALCRHPECKEVVAVPRLMPNPSEPLPDRLTFVAVGAGGKMRYITTVLRILRRDRNFDLLLCGHINLLPLAYMAGLWLRIPILLEVYGIDAWSPTRSRIANRLVNRVGWFISISDITKRRFLGWADLPYEKGFLLPNAVHLEQYGPGEKDGALLDRYGLRDKTVVMTLGRMVGSERYKGFDILMELLPGLSESIPDIAYLIAGDGADRPRLEKKAVTLGVAQRVIFTGLIPEAEKAAHYRLADVYAMPSRGEGFGFVFLEAMACGIPVVGSRKDGGREALRNGELGVLVDPDSKEEITAGILEALKRPRGVIPEGLDYFSYPRFEQRLHGIVGQLIAGRAAAGSQNGSQI